MQGIQPSTLSDEEFERHVWLSVNAAGALPKEIADELQHRVTHGGRDKERSYDAHNPKQLTLPFPQ